LLPPRARNISDNEGALESIDADNTTLKESAESHRARPALSSVGSLGKAPPHQIDLDAAYKTARNGGRRFRERSTPARALWLTPLYPCTLRGTFDLQEAEACILESTEAYFLRLSFGADEFVLAESPNGGARSFASPVRAADFAFRLGFGRVRIGHCLSMIEEPADQCLSELIECPDQCNRSAFAPPLALGKTD
jgi:hypothetical protein